MTIARFAGLNVAAVLLLALATGCESAGVQKRLARRERNIERTVAMGQRIESRRPENLKRTVNLAERQIKRDEEATARNLTKLQHIPQEETERWQQREPAHRKRIQHELAGNLDSIKRTWPLGF